MLRDFASLVAREPRTVVNESYRGTVDPVLDCLPDQHSFHLQLVPVSVIEYVLKAARHKDVRTRNALQGLNVLLLARA